MVRLQRPFIKLTLSNIYIFIFKLFRPNRMHNLARLFNLSAEHRVLDVGGTEFNWTLIPIQPELFLLNISGPNNEHGKVHKWIIADGRHLPFEANSFDIVFSNSVIEHLSNFENQALFAREVRRVGRQYFVQTPNKYFPIEPHYLTPFIHWLPPWFRTRLVRNFTIHGLFVRPNRQECEQMVEEIRLLNIEDMKILFPNANIHQERFLGVTKSIIATSIS